jgi:hypothetical protein
MIADAVEPIGNTPEEFAAEIKADSSYGDAS